MRRAAIVLLVLVGVAVLAALAWRPAERRCGAALELGRAGDPASAAQLVEKLDDEANTLPWLEQVAQSLLFAAQHRTVASCAEDALRTLGSAATPALIEAFPQAARPVRRRIANVLVTSRDPRARSFLAAQVRHSEPEVRQRALIALDQADATTAESALQEALHDPSPLVRRQALDLSSRRNATWVNEALLAAMKDSSAEVRAVAADRAGGRQMSEAVPSLEALLQDPDIQVRQKAAKSLKQIATRNPL